jgi:hypothetical protein
MVSVSEQLYKRPTAAWRRADKRDLERLLEPDGIEGSLAFAQGLSRFPELSDLVKVVDKKAEFFRFEFGEPKPK